MDTCELESFCVHRHPRVLSFVHSIDREVLSSYVVGREGCSTSQAFLLYLFGDLSIRVSLFRSSYPNLSARR